MFCYTFENIPCRKNESYYVQQTAGKELSSELHTHDFYELFAICTGSCTARINGQEYLLSPGMTVFLSPGHTHCFLSQEEETDLFSMSVKREEFDSLRFLFSPNVSFKDPLFYSKDHDFCDFSLLSFKSTEPIIDGSITEKRLFLASLLEALSHWEKAGASSTIIDQLEKNIAKDAAALSRGISAMTEISGYSRSHLSRLILSLRGETAGAFLRRLRLEYAYRSIISTSMSFESIAESVGFTSYSHFHHIFSAAYGISPAALRKRIPGTTI